MCIQTKVLNTGLDRLVPRTNWNCAEHSQRRIRRRRRRRKLRASEQLHAFVTAFVDEEEESESCELPPPSSSFLFLLPFSSSFTLPPSAPSARCKLQRWGEPSLSPPPPSAHCECRGEPFHVSIPAQTNTNRSYHPIWTGFYNLDSDFSFVDGSMQLGMFDFWNTRVTEILSNAWLVGLENKCWYCPL